MPVKTMAGALQQQLTSGTVKPSISTSPAGSGLLGLLPLPAASSAFLEAVRATLPIVSTLILRNNTAVMHK